MRGLHVPCCRSWTMAKSMRQRVRQWRCRTLSDQFSLQGQPLEVTPPSNVDRLTDVFQPPTTLCLYPKTMVQAALEAVSQVIEHRWDEVMVTYSFNGRSVYQESRANASFAEPRSLVSRPDEQRSNLPCRRRMIRAARSNMREICVSMTEANVEGRRRDEDRRRDELVNTIVEGRNLANLYMVERQWTGWRTSQRTMG